MSQQLPCLHSAHSQSTHALACLSLAPLAWTSVCPSLTTSCVTTQYLRLLYCPYCVLAKCTHELGWGVAGCLLLNTGVSRACFAPGQLLAVAFTSACVVLSVTVALTGDCCLIDPQVHSEGVFTALGVHCSCTSTGLASGWFRGVCLLACPCHIH